MHRAALLLLIATLVASCSPRVDFNADIRPILNERCVDCHGGIRRQGDLNLLFRSEALAEAESGLPAVVPGKPNASELIRRVSHGNPEVRMPQEGHALSKGEVRMLRQWIRAGAPWDAHWAYVAPERPALPAIKQSEWPQQDLDRFVLAKLEDQALEPSPPAACPTLVRRVTLDLIGLAATPDDVASVCEGVTTYEAYVEKLLDSPHYGERWAAMWLDLARYADSKGYEKDIGRTIWRYRDWVVDAFNADMPFDQFTVEQLAGDLLPAPTEDQLIATAFNRNTMTNTEGGTDDEEFRVAAVVDRVNTTWEVWQGTSFACVQCHGHPYDPFRHAEYYQFFAFFNNTVDRDYDDEYPTLPRFDAETTAAGTALMEEWERLDQEILRIALEDSIARARREWEALLDRPEVIGRVRNMLQNEVRRVALTPEIERDAAQQTLIASVYADISTDSRLEILRKRRSEVRQEINVLSPLQTPIMRELPQHKQRKTYVFERGSFLTRGEAVTAGTPQALPPLPDSAPRNRLGMAQWLVSEENPLTARVTVNRFWEQLFGTGIVESLEDFGTQGYAPSHPDLLDHLAVTFREDQAWSVKDLLRTLVTSATYQQSSHITPLLLELDPYNRLLARGPRFRLTAEQIRDQALFVSGLLSTRMHGPPVMPPQPEGLWNNPYDSRQWQTSEGEDRYRRALYTYWRRTIPYPSMVTFDSPTREFCLSRRLRTNTPLQALVGLNDPVYVEAAQALARRMETRAEGAQEQLAEGYRLALSRAPAPAALAELTALYDKALAHYENSPEDAPTMGGTAHQAALAMAASAIMNLDSFVTKE